MSEERTQTYADHAKYVPGYHFLTLGATVLYLVYALWRVVTAFSLPSVMLLVGAIAIGGLSWYVRLFPLGVHDRLIRLEMLLRLSEVLPEELAARIGDLSTGQLVALRFAPDDELPGLVGAVLDEGLKDRGEIKRRIQRWQPDEERI